MIQKVKDSTSKGPHIDVFSTAFDKGYMKSASTSGYQGIYTGMTRKEVEEKFGKSDGNVDSSNYTYEKYGNLAVAYENDEVVHVGWPLMIFQKINLSKNITNLMTESQIN